MAVTPRLDLRQTQSLVMTPQLQQAIKLLQLNTAELATYIEAELEQNPLLIRDEGAEEEEGRREDIDDGAGDGPDGAAVADEEPHVPDSAEMAEADGCADSPLDLHYQDQWDEDAAGDAMARPAGDGLDAPPRWEMGAGAEGSELDLEQVLERPVSLRDHLLAQIELELQEPADRVIGAALIELLDEAGYIARDYLELAEALACPGDRVESTLARLQEFDPPGIFARDLKECLALQLKDRNRYDPAMQVLLDNLALLARRDLPQLRKLCNVDAEDLAEMIGEIRALNPKPALAFDAPALHPVTPDVFLRRQHGSWVVELNTDSLPRVLVDGQYYARVSRESRTKHERDYVAECYQSANWLVRALHQRATTILRVAREIVRQQEAFFARGVEHLRPLILRDIAEAIGMHESTVSRVTTNKYIATPRGLFELKYFFTSAIASRSGESPHSAESVRYRIRILIANEPASRVLSDDGIADILRGEGLDIARRTVAKYREAMRIPSSVERRRLKAPHV